uniref:Plasminogen activator, urokinase receptor n=1 Tax=Homo sapiens TaxID=9606 RepID=M0R0L1_HUMAN
MGHPPLLPLLLLLHTCVPAWATARDSISKKKKRKKKERRNLRRYNL